MRQIFPVRICKCNPKGFTFVEVVIALAVASILLGVATSTVVTALRAEQTVLWRNEANLIADEMIAVTYLGEDPSNTIVKLDSSWTLENAIHELSNITWKAYTIYKKDRSSARIDFALRSQ